MLRLIDNLLNPTDDVIVPLGFLSHNCHGLTPQGMIQIDFLIDMHSIPQLGTKTYYIIGNRHRLNLYFYLLLC